MKIAIIPARGGSKRIPRKNIKVFCGKPIIAYSIVAALECGLFDRVLVSTDDEEIAEVSVKCGAQVPFLRPLELSDDYTGTGAVIKHAIGWFRGRGENVTSVCCIYATAPFIQSEFLIQGYDRLILSGKSYAFTVTSYAFPIQRSLRITVNGDVEAIYPEYRETRSQDLEGAYHDAGQFYWGKADAYLVDIPVFSHESAPIVIPRHFVQDIDTPEDWRRAELMYAAWQMDVGR